MSLTTQEAHRLRVFGKSSVVWKILLSTVRKRKFYNVELYDLYVASHVGDDMLLSQARWPDTYQNYVDSQVLYCDYCKIKENEIHTRFLS